MGDIKTLCLVKKKKPDTKDHVLFNPIYINIQRNLQKEKEITGWQGLMEENNRA